MCFRLEIEKKNVLEDNKYALVHHLYLVVLNKMVQVVESILFGKEAYSKWGLHISRK